MKHIVTFASALVLAACESSEPAAPAEAKRAGTTGTTTETAPARSALDAAHEAYLAGDWIALGERVRDVLLQPNTPSSIADNAYALLDKAYEAQGANLPSAFVLPSDVKTMNYSQV